MPPRGFFHPPHYGDGISEVESREFVMVIISSANAPPTVCNQSDQEHLFMKFKLLIILRKTNDQFWPILYSKRLKSFGLRVTDSRLDSTRDKQDILAAF
eukprot:6004258-Pyramimonas_sp.AAC.1